MYLALEISGLTYHYPDTGLGIVDIDLRLERGSLTVITGQRGAGATTLLRTMTGRISPHRGEIRWNGKAICDPAHLFVPPRCAYIPQTPPLDPGASPDGGIPDNLVDAFAHRPELLIVDDVSSMLSVHGERRLWGSVFNQRVSQTMSACVAVSRRWPALVRADQVVVLKAGRVEAVGNLYELLETNEEMQRIWHHA